MDNPLRETLEVIQSNVTILLLTIEQELSKPIPDPRVLAAVGNACYPIQMQCFQLSKAWEDQIINSVLAQASPVEDLDIQRLLDAINGLATIRCEVCGKSTRLTPQELINADWSPTDNKWVCPDCKLKEQA